MANRIEGNQSCPQCGANVPGDSLFCPACGTAVRPSRMARRRRAAAETGPRGGSLWGLIGILVVIGGVLLALHLIHRPAAPVGTAAGSGPKTSRGSKKTPTKAQSGTPSSHPKTGAKRPRSGSTQAGTGSKPHRAKTGRVQPPTKTHRKKRPHTSLSHPKRPSAPKLVTAPGGWVQASLTAKGATVTVTIPHAYDHPIVLGAHNSWRFADPTHPSERVTVRLLPPSASAPAGTNELGPGAYGTAIATTGGLASQTLYVQWSGHAWVAVAMHVPAADESWLGTIAQSVRIG